MSSTPNSQYHVYIYGIYPEPYIPTYYIVSIFTFDIHHLYNLITASYTRFLILMEETSWQWTIGREDLLWLQ